MSYASTIDVSIRPAEETAPGFQRLRIFLLAALPALLPFSKVIMIGNKGINFAAADLVLPLGCIFLMSRLFAGKLRIPFFGFASLALAVIAFGTVLNFDLSLSVRGPANVVIEFVKGVSLWFYFYLVVNVIDEASDVAIFAGGWAVSSAIVAATGIAGSLAYMYWGIQNDYALMFRAQGTFDDSNLFAAHMAVSFYIAVLFARMRRSGWWWIPAVLALLLGGIVFSASRGALLAMVGTLGILLFVGSSTRTRLVAAALGAVIVFAAVAVPDSDGLVRSNPVAARLSTVTVDLDDPAAKTRKALWSKAVDEFLYSPWLGTGRGNYGALRGEFGGHAHNTYLGLLSEIGLAGLMGSLAMVALIAFPSIRAAVWPAHAMARPAAMCLLLALLSIALAGLTINIENYRGLWTTLALLEGARRTGLVQEAAVPE